MKVDRDRRDHMLPILLAQECSDGGDEGGKTSKEVGNAALEDTSSILRFCKTPCLLCTVLHYLDDS